MPKKKSSKKTSKTTTISQKQSVVVNVNTGRKGTSRPRPKPKPVQQSTQFMGGQFGAQIASLNSMISRLPMTLQAERSPYWEGNIHRGNNLIPIPTLGGQQTLQQQLASITPTQPPVSAEPSTEAVEIQEAIPVSQKELSEDGEIAQEYLDRRREKRESYKTAEEKEERQDPMEGKTEHDPGRAEEPPEQSDNPWGISPGNMRYIKNAYTDGKYLQAIKADVAKDIIEKILKKEIPEGKTPKEHLKKLLGKKVTKYQDIPELYRFYNPSQTDIRDRPS